MINYIEKGIWLHREIERQGHTLVCVTDEAGAKVFVSSDDVAVQLIIDTFDPLPEAKLSKIEELRAEGLRRANLIYQDDALFPTISSIQLILDIDSTYSRPGARASRIQGLIDLQTAFDTIKNQINAQTDLATLEAFDLSSHPAWP